jgi:hypothetical protein
MVSKRNSAALGSAAFFVAGPVVSMGVVPWRLTRWVVHALPGAAALGRH